MMKKAQDEIYTTSSIGAFQACPKMYDLRINKRLEAIDRPSYFVLGSLFHEAKEQWALAVRDGDIGNALGRAIEVIGSADVKDEDVRCKATEMIRAYSRRYLTSDTRLEYLSIEEPFRCKTPMGKSLAGICDGIVRDVGGKLWVLETKTAATVDESYKKRMSHQRQAMLYTYAMTRATGHSGYDVVGVLYDFVQKPSIRRKKATPADKMRYTKDGELYSGQREYDEGDAEYMERIRKWYHDGPEGKLQRMEVVFSRHQLDAFEKSIHKTIKLIEVCGEEFGEDGWPESQSACMANRTPCEFSDYCWSGDSELQLRSFYRKKERRFMEFKESMGDEDATNTTN